MKAATVQVNGHMKKQVRDNGIVIAEMKKIIRSHADVINEHAKFINVLAKQNQELKRRVEKLEFKKGKIIIPV